MDSAGSPLISSVIGGCPNFDERSLLALSVQTLDDNEHAILDPRLEQGGDLGLVRPVRGIEPEGASNRDPHPVLRLRVLAPAALGDGGLDLAQVRDGHVLERVGPRPPRQRPSASAAWTLRRSETVTSLNGSGHAHDVTTPTLSSGPCSSPFPSPTDVSLYHSVAVAGARLPSAS